MKLPLILIALFIVLTNCTNDCKPAITTYREVNPLAKGYFPYKAGKKVKFTRYNDTVKVKELEFRIDTSSFIESRERYYECHGGGDRSYEYKEIRHFRFTLVNLTEDCKDWTIEINDNEYDDTELNVKLNSLDFMVYDFPEVLAHGSTYYSVDSIIVNNKNYGPGLCVRPPLPNRIYFNSKYGILKYVNDATGEQLLYLE